MSAHVTADRLLLFAAGELPDLDRRSVEEHLESCEACRDEADLLKRNTVFLRERLSSLTGLVQPDLSFLQATAAPKPKAAAKDHAPRERKRLPVLVPVAAVILVLGAAGYLLVTSKSGESDETDANGEAATRVTRTQPEREPRTGPEQPERTTRPEPSPGERPVKEPRPTAVRGGVPILLPKLLTSPTQRTLEQVWEALEAKPEHADQILRSLDDTNSEEEKRVVLTLTLVGIRETREGRDVLVGLLTADGSPAVRAAAGAAMGHVKAGKGSRLPVTTLLSVKTGAIEDDQTRAALLAAAETERDPEVIGTLVRLLAASQKTEPSILPKLVELARSENEAVRGHALTAIVDGIRAGKLEDPAPILELVRMDELPVTARATIVGALGPALGDGATDSLLRIYRDVEEIELRVAAVTALGEVSLSDPKALAELVTILRSGESPRIRTAALAGVARSRDAQSAEILKEIADGDQDEGIRKAAKLALKERGGR